MTFYRKRVFPLLSFVLWLWFLTLDLTGWGDSDWVKYAAICLCCLTALPGAKTPDGRLVAAALCLTVGADWFLLVRDDHYEIGVMLFIAVQFLYAWRLVLIENGLLNPVGLLFRGLGVVAFFVLVFRNEILNALAVLYFFNLWANLQVAWGGSRWWGSYHDPLAAVTDPLLSRFCWGLFLLMCCDICVGLSNLDVLTSVTWWLCWAFYLPSQVLIVLSQETGDTYEKIL